MISVPKLQTLYEKTNGKEGHNFSKRKAFFKKREVK